MFDFFKKNIFLVLSCLVILIFAKVHNICAHEGSHENDYCQIKSVCETCKKCPLCSIFDENGVIQESKEKLLETKEKLEQALSKEQAAKFGQKAIESIQDSLAKVDEKLDSLVEK